MFEVISLVAVGAHHEQEKRAKRKLSHPRQQRLTYNLDLYIEFGLKKNERDIQCCWKFRLKPSHIERAQEVRWRNERQMLSGLCLMSFTLYV